MNKTIWMVWLQGLESAPDIVKTCHASWVQNNPGWEVKLLTSEDIENYVPEVNQLIDKNKDLIIYPHIADLIRVNLLKKHGGVWADATSFCCNPLDNWLLPALDVNGIYMFKEPHSDKLSDNWFIAAYPNSTLMATLTHFINEYWTKSKFYSVKFKMLNKLITKLVVSAFSHKTPRTSSLIVHPVFHEFFKVYPYFWFHFSFNRQYFKNKEFQEAWDAQPCLTAKMPLSLNHAHLRSSINDYPLIKEQIDNIDCPVYKLHKNVDLNKVPNDSLIMYLLKKHGF